METIIEEYGGIMIVTVAIGAIFALFEIFQIEIFTVVVKLLSAILYR